MAMVIVSTENIPGTNWRYGRPSLWLVAARAGKPRLSNTLIDVEQREAGKLMGDFSHLPSTNVPLLISIPHIHPTSERNHHHPKKEAIFFVTLTKLAWYALINSFGFGVGQLSYNTIISYIPRIFKRPKRPSDASLLFGVTASRLLIRRGVRENFCAFVDRRSIKRVNA